MVREAPKYEKVAGCRGSRAAIVFERAPSLNCATCGQALESDGVSCARCGSASAAAPPLSVVSDPEATAPGSSPARVEAPAAGESLETGGFVELHPTLSPIRSGLVFEGKWRIEKKIGEGGMGTVFLARDLQLDRQVAVKVLSSALAHDPEVVSRFEREARLTASLEHPNIVPVYAVGSNGGRPFIVMKLLEGETLAGVLRQKGALQRDELLRLMRQLALGLDFIHAKGYVHRDVKTGNIFVGSDGHATILDFGILRPSRSKEALTRTGVVMGTPQYMSPEQALGARDIDHRADLYALAVILFECITGSLPFDGESELELIQLQAHAPPPEVLPRAPWVPKAVGEVVARALSKRPEDRYASAGELCDALEAAYFSEHPESAESTQPGTSGSLEASRTALSWRKRAQSGDGSPFASPPRHAGSSGPLGSSGSAPFPLVNRAPTPATGSDLKPPRSPLPWAILGGFVAVSALLGFGWGLLGRNAGSRGNEIVAALPDSGGSASASGAIGAVESAADAGPDEQLAVTALVEESDAGTEGASAGGGEVAQGLPEVPTASGAPGERRSTRKTQRAKAGHLNVVASHKGEPYWAEVTVDGVLRGRTPLLLELPSGPHRVRVERAGFRPHHRRIMVVPGGTAVIRVKLVQ